MSFLKSIFKKSEGSISDLNLKTDLHSHLLPNLDDGAKSVENSLELIRGLMALGYRRFITTPHVMGDYYKNDREDIRIALDVLREAIAKEGLDVTIDASAEYYLDEWFFEKIEKKDLLPFGENYILIETSFMNKPAGLLDAFFRIKVAGYQPVFAHPERYIYLYENISEYEEIYEKEVLFQVNINSLNGYYSDKAKEYAEELIERGMVDFLGSDTHNMKHINRLAKPLDKGVLGKLKNLNLRNNTL